MSDRPTPVAPWWHTAILISFFVGLAAAGLLFQHKASANPAIVAQHPNVIPLYLSLIVAEWGLVLYVARGMRRTGTTLRDLMGGPLTDRRHALTDVVLAVGVWAAWSLLQFAWNHWLGAAHAASIRPLLAERLVEIPAWIALSVTAGFAEEIVFRGYLQRQFGAWTGNAALALIAQALVFGIGHGYQGIDACARITVFGVIFGLLAMWRRSLRPGMMAHAFTDIVAGIV
jgi:membrane protease YdiL (CAAX protease family)